MTHQIKCIYFQVILLLYTITRKEGNVLFNDTLNTFLFTVIWRRKYGMVIQIAREWYPLPPLHGLLFPISNNVSFICTIHSQNSERRNPLAPHELLFYMHYPTYRTSNITIFVPPVVQHWLEREIAQMFTSGLHLAPYTVSCWTITIIWCC